MPELSPTPYDKVLYPSQTRLQTHPDRLATIGLLLGMEPAPVERCRVLELGCGNGSNLAPMAFGLPQSEFVGVDLAATPINAAQAMARELNLKNLTFHRASITEVNEQFGTFDYIICHGVYSWVPEEVRQAILRVFGQLLRPQGIAFLSYNAYPGNRIREMVREMMLFHVKGFEEAEEQINQARALAGFVSSAQDDTDLYRQLLKEEMDRFLVYDGHYVFHDALAEINTPFYFHQVTEAAAAHGLAYLGEAEFHEMLDQNLPPRVAEKLNELSGNRVAREQYLDFLRCRRFRHTLLCRDDVQLDLSLKPELASRFFMAALSRPAAAEPSLADRKIERFEGIKGAAIQTSCPYTKMALVILADHWPQGVAFPILVAEAKEKLRGVPGWDQSQEEALEEDLKKTFLKSFAAGLVELHTYAPRIYQKVSGKPRATDLARWQALHHSFVTTIFHSTLTVDDPLIRRLFSLLDGTRDRTELLEALSIQMQEAGPAATTGEKTESPERSQEALGKALDENLKKMARSGLLDG